MSAGPQHPCESERLASLRSYQLLDTDADAVLDTLTAAAARALDAPCAAISLLDSDRVWFKSTIGLSALLGHPLRQVPRAESFGAHVLGAHVLVVGDAREDPRFAHLPMVTGAEQLRAFAGAPLIGRDGLTLGTLCVLDRRARRFDAEAIEVLTDLAAAVTELLELRRADATAGLASSQVRAESHRLRAGLDAGQLIVHYQPVVDLQTRRWLGLEALVRWAHPERGLLPPSAFLPLAEASGLIVPLGREVLIQACMQLAAWRSSVPAAVELHVAVNLSGRQLSEPDVVEVITQALAASGLPPQALILELTETSLAAAAVEVDIAVQRIRSLGVTLALDDFGTGYASFSYLQRFHPDIVKIDRCFVSALGRSERDDLLLRSLVSLGLELGCDVVAEGVETVEQAQVLADLG
ncbi:MAG: EAL domain-containing protein, partial [Janthinobacterium lividum]